MAKWTLFPTACLPMYLIFSCVIIYNTFCVEARRIKYFTANGFDFKTHIDQIIEFSQGINVTLKCTVNGKWLPSPIFILDRDDRVLNGTSSLTEIVFTIHNLSCMDRGPYHCKTRDHKDARNVKTASIDLDVRGCPPQLCTNNTDPATVTVKLRRAVSWIVCILGIVNKPNYPVLRHLGSHLKPHVKTNNIYMGLDRNYGSRLVHWIEMTLNNVTSKDLGVMNISIVTDLNTSIGYSVNIQRSKNQKKATRKMEENESFTTPPSPTYETMNTTLTTYYQSSLSISTTPHAWSNHHINSTVHSMTLRSEGTGSEPTHLIVNVILFVALFLVILGIIIYILRKRLRQKMCPSQDQHIYTVVQGSSRPSDDTPPLPPRRRPHSSTRDVTIVEHVSSPPSYSDVFIQDGLMASPYDPTHIANYNMRGRYVDCAHESDAFKHNTCESCNTTLKQFVSPMASSDRRGECYLEHRVIPKTSHHKEPDDDAPSNLL